MTSSQTPDPPKEVPEETPAPLDPNHDPVAPENPQPSDPAPEPVAPESPEEDPFDNGNFPV